MPVALAVFDLEGITADLPIEGGLVGSLDSVGWFHLLSLAAGLTSKVPGSF